MLTESGVSTAAGGGEPVNVNKPNNSELFLSDKSLQSTHEHTPAYIQISILALSSCCLHRNDMLAVLFSEQLTIGRDLGVRPIMKSGDYHRTMETTNVVHR